MPTPRTVVYRARRIRTLDPMRPEATHVAVRDGRILAVGDLAACAAWGPHDLDERYVDAVLLPGFVEGHAHLSEGPIWDSPYVGWFDRRDPQGRVWNGLRSAEAVAERLREADAGLRSDGKPEREPLVAWGFDPIYAGGARMTCRDLDRVSATRPVVVSHANGHLLTVNSAALALGAVDRDCEVEGVMRFEDGTPNGELQEPAAMHLVLRKLGEIGVLRTMTVPGIGLFERLATLTGVTTSTDLVNRLGPADVAVLEQATARDDCAVRLLPAFQAFHGTHRAAEGAEHVRALTAKNTDRLRFGLVKMMLDGSIQGFSARLRWPGYFNGAPNGIWVTAPAQYEADFETYHRAGLTVHTHTNGDEASEVAIEAIERVLARAPRPSHRHTLQHGQMIDAALFRRMRAQGLAANLFANHVWYWGDQHFETTMGPDRAERVDACASALAAGVTLAIHSDAPVTPLGPLHVAWCAVNRLTPKGRLLGASERIGVLDALRAITLGPAWTIGLDGEIGTIACGKRADFAILADDPLEVAPEALKDVRVLGTVLSGRPFVAG